MSKLDAVCGEQTSRVCLGVHVVGGDRSTVGAADRACERSFAALVDGHIDAAYSLALSMSGRRAMAENIVEEAFVSLWREGVRYDPARGSVRAWVLSAVHHRAVEALRRERVACAGGSVGELVAEQVDVVERTEAEVVRRDDARRVREAIAALPDEQRRVIELAYFGGLTHSRIGVLHELPPGTVKGRMRLALRKLHACLDPARHAPEAAPRKTLGDRR